MRKYILRKEIIDGCSSTYIYTTKEDLIEEVSKTKKVTKIFLHTINFIYCFVLTYLVNRFVGYNPTISFPIMSIGYFPMLAFLFWKTVSLELWCNKELSLGK